MLFYFLITIVFIAEIIIAANIIFFLVKFDKMFIGYNAFLEEAKPMIKDIMVTCRKISEQLTELAPAVVEKIKTIVTSIIMNQFKSMLGALTFWLVKKEVEKQLN